MRTPALVLLLWALISAGPLLAQPGQDGVLLLNEDFEAQADGALPPGWLPLEGDWFAARRASRVLRQGDQDLTRESWVLGTWGDYSIVTTFRADDGPGAWSVGVTAYRDPAGRAYRARVTSDKLYLDKLGESVAPLAAGEATAARRQWYCLRLTVCSAATTTLRARVWPAGAPEPNTWNVSHEDRDEPLRGGSIGLWSGHCACRFQRVEVGRVKPDGSPLGPLYAMDLGATGPGALPALWEVQGGVWLRDMEGTGPVLRQVRVESGARFDDTAALVLSCRGYTVSARMLCHPGPGKWGLGLVAYYGALTGSYRLRLLDGRAYLLKRLPGGRVMTLASAPFEARRGRWYGATLAVDELATGVQLSGKVWAADGREPGGWLLTASDSSPLPGGAPGAWAFGGAADFDDFQVRTSLLSTLNATLTAP